MQPREDGSYYLELPDLIRMNQLVRGQINLAGFQDWYDTLCTGEQVALLCEMHHFAQQGGGREPVFLAATKAAQLREDDPGVALLAQFRGDMIRESRLRLDEWLRDQEASERRRLLPLLVYYFGLAEGAVYSQETVEYCNHWWHRDLLDPRVVANLLNDPKFFYTSMKDDLAIKQG